MPNIWSVNKASENNITNLGIYTSPLFISSIFKLLYKRNLSARINN